MYFANEQLIGIQVLYPNLLPQVIALSYNGGIYMNLVVDPEMIRCVRSKFFGGVNLFV